MDYFVQRGDQKFGPYSLAEIQEYIHSGRILLSDQAQSEGMTEWVPISQIIGNIPIPSSVPVSPTPAQEFVPLPPNLHWSVILVFLFLARFSSLFFPPLSSLGLLFIIVWAIILANWARRLVKDNKALVLVAMFPAGIVASILAAGAGVGAGLDFQTLVFVRVVLRLAGWIAYIIGIFKIRAAMEEYYNSTENIGLTLNGGMTFFFSLVYLQYHVNEIARRKKASVLS